MRDNSDTEDHFDSMLRGVAAAPAEAPPTEPIGVVMGRYRIVGLLGRGGMGSVYEAEDTELDRRVALKLVRIESTDREITSERFRRERALTAELEHPNIMPIYDCGVSPSGEPYYVMRIARGEPLDRLIARGETLAARLALVPNLVAVADAVAFAHSRGIVHRDLKPHNILIGAFGETLVADWGLAKRLNQPDDGPVSASPLPPAGDEHTATRHGEVIGTPAYMAPEQARGGPVDGRTDVFALGAMLHHLLAQRPPSDQDRTRPSKPSRELDADVLAAIGAPPDLVAIARKALAADPVGRYQSAKDLADELRRYLAGQIVEARRYSRSDLIRRWAGRHRPELAVGGTLGALLVVVGIASIVRIVHERDDARTERTAAESARAESSRRNEDLVLLQARAELTRDPTASLAWLARYPDTAPHWDVAAAIATDAASRSVAHDVWTFGRSLGSIAFTTDGREVVVGSLDGSLVFVDAATGKRRAFHADDGVGDRIVASPDGVHLATTDGHEVVRVWDRTTGESRKLVGEHIGGQNLQFDRDGIYVLARHSGGGARVWRVSDGAPIALPGDDGERLVAFVVGQPGVVAVATGTSLSLVELATGARRASVDLGAHPFDLQSTGDGRELAATFFTKLALWNPSSGLRWVDPHLGVVALVTPSHDGASLMSCGHQEVQIWQFDIATATGHLVSKDERCFRTGFQFSPDGSSFVSLGLGGELRLHQLHEGTMQRLLGHDGAVTDATFSPDGSWLASTGTDGSVRLWRLGAGDTRLFHRTRELDRAALDGTMLVTDAGGVAIVDLMSGKRTPLADAKSSVVESCSSRDGTTAAFYAADRQLRVFDLRTGTSRTFAVPDLSISGRAPTGCSSKGDQLAQIVDNGTLRIVDLATGTSRVAAKLGDAGLSILYSPDDRTLAIASRDRVVVAIDPTTGAEKRRIVFPAMVWNVSWSTDGTKLGGVCSDGVVRVVDMTTGSMTTLVGHVGTATGVTFMPDGKHVLTSGADATIRVWDLATGIGRIVRREQFSIASINMFGSTSLVVDRGDQVGLVRVWDTASLPPMDLDPATLRAWKRRVTTAEVDAAGLVATPW